VSKIFIISLDGATFDVLRPLMNQGYMPNLLRLSQEGITAGLESVIPWVTAPAWTSFMTGKNPEKHGVFDFTRFDESRYCWQVNNSTSIQSKTLWQLLSEHGKRVIVLNLPYTYPPYEVNGIMVSGWDAPFLEEGFTHPRPLSKEILDLMPDYASSLNLPLGSHFATESDELFERFTGKLVRGVEQGTQLSLYLMQKHAWDVFMVHFQQTDWMQHNLWSYIEDAAQDCANKEPRIEKVRQCYQSFDRAVGQLLDGVSGANATVIVLSDHGFGSHQGEVFPNYWLKRWGYYVPASSSNGNGSSRPSSAMRFLRKGLSRTMSLLHTSQKQTSKQFKSWEDMLAENIPRSRMQVDWAKTKAALVVASHAGFVFVNVKGRAPLGAVEPEQYEAVVSDLIEKFLEVRDQKSGVKLFSMVERGSAIYPNPSEGISVPDIVLIPDKAYAFSYKVSDASLETSHHGWHRRSGVLFIRGPELKRETNDLSPRLIDVAPTILHLLGLPIPTDMDGRVLEEIFSAAQNPKYVEVNNSSAQRSQDYSEEESALIESRLKALGYIN
jgi:predicted AlkP superfamily phosphohydrolase/phosphomutase